MKTVLGEEIDLFRMNIIWEPTLSPFEKALLLDIEFKCRLSHEASTESNKTIGIRLGREKPLAPEHISSSLSGMVKKGWLAREKYFGLTQRRFILSEQTICMLKNKYIDWYYLRVKKYGLPPMTMEELASRVGRKSLEKYLPKLQSEGLIKD